MSKKTPDGKRKAGYEVGYCKPPKEHRFKPKQPGASPAGAKTSRKKRKASEPQAVDIYALLSEPVRVRKGERMQSMDPFEVMVRKQLELALKEHTTAAMKRIIDYAIAYELIKKSPRTIEGGVMLIPMITKADIEFVRSFCAPAKSNQGRGCR